MNKRLIGWMLALAIVLTATSLARPHGEGRPSREDIPAARMIADPYPAFNGIAVDAKNNMVVTSDANRKSLLLYNRSQSAMAGAASVPLRQIIGPETYLGMVAAVIVDPERHEIYTANNDIEDTVVVMPYEAKGNARPVRVFSVPHQSWGLAFSSSNDEIAVTVEIQNALVFYRRAANGVEAPLRILRGPNTGLADPHGVYWDEAHQEVGVANHGNFRGVAKNIGSGCVPTSDDDTSEGGEFRPPSITIYSSVAKDDTKPLRTIQGPRTGLDWPMGIAEDSVHNTIVVANNGDSSILIFDRNGRGDAAPLRTIRGDRTGINRPMGLAVDAKNGEIWVSNYGDHSALAFDSTANGNVAPRRILRSAPAGTPTPGFGNPMALAYDCKRGEILVPN